MKKVLATYSDFGACAQYRITEPYNNIKSDLIQFDLINPIDGVIMLDAQKMLDEYNAVILQRAWDENLIPLIKEFQSRGGKVVYEIDDDPFHIPDHNPDKPQFTTERLSAMREIINFCDALHVSTPELANAISHPNKTVFLNGIDFSKYHINRRDELREKYNIPLDAKVVMWAGGNSHSDSLELIEQVIHQLVRDKIYVVLVSNKSWLNFLGFHESEYLKIIDWIPLPVFYRIYYIADVVLAPLVDNGFNRCKSENRCLESVACGVISFCSNVAPYRRYHTKTGMNILITKERTKNWLKGIYDFFEINDANYYKFTALKCKESVNILYNLNSINRQRADWWENFLGVSAGSGQARSVEQ